VILLPLNSNTREASYYEYDTMHYALCTTMLQFLIDYLRLLLLQPRFPFAIPSTVLVALKPEGVREQTTLIDLCGLPKAYCITLLQITSDLTYKTSTPTA
jgi:hypothetical protein